MRGDQGGFGLLKVAVVRFPGSNCDLDAVAAVKSTKGLVPKLVWHEDNDIDSFDAVVCQGIGRGAINRMAQVGVPVYVHEGPDVASAVAAFRSRSLQIAGADNSCSGSGSCGGDGHHHDN